MTILILSLISFFRAAYTLFLFSYSQHGKISSGLFAVSSGYVREYLLLFLHWAPLNLLIMKREPILLWICLGSLIKILICGVKDVRFALGNTIKCLYLFL